MSIHVSWLVTTALLASAITSPTLADSKRASPSVQLEVIVKFSDDSEAGRRVDNILKQNPNVLSGLSDLQEQLHQSTGFVLLPERVTSGRELIFRVPEEPLLERVKKGLTQRSEVASAELVAFQDNNPRLPESGLLVRFHPSTDEATLLHEAHANPADHERVQAMTLRLCAAGGVPVLGFAQAADTLTVTVDRYALLEALVKRLNALEDVDYAQANSTIQFMK